MSNYLWIEGAGMTGFFDFEDALDPRDDFVRARIRRFVQVDVAGAHVVVDVPPEGRSAEGQRRVVSGAHVHAVEVFEEQRPH